MSEHRDETTDDDRHDAPQPNPADPDNDAGDPGDDEADQLVLSPPDEATTTRDFLMWAAVLFLAALAAYGPALVGQFLWDDDRHVTSNPTLLTLDGLRRIWTDPGATPQWYPLTHTSYWFEYQFLARGADGQLNPLVFHVTNALLHAGAATALWFVLRRLRVPGGWLAAAVFALHPVAVESVAWVSERDNVLSALLYFGSVLAYLQFAGVGEDEERGSGVGVQGSGGVGKGGASDAAGSPAKTDYSPYWLALGLFVAALLSKTVACSMPAVVLVLLWWKGRLDRRHLALLAPFLVLGFAAAGVTVWVERTHVGAVGPDWDLSLAQRVLIAGRAVWFYLSKLVWPRDLTFVYPRWDVNPADAVQWLYPLGVVAVLAVLWALRNRIGRGPVAAAAIYVGVLVPALGFVNVYPMRYAFVADRFQYHASAAALAGLVALVVVAYRRLTGTRGAPATASAPAPAPPPAAAAAPAAPNDETAPAGAAAAPAPSPLPYVLAGALLLVLSVTTWRQARAYDNDASLWEDTIAKNDRAWVAYANLGAALMESGNLFFDAGDRDRARELHTEAIDRLTRAIELRPQLVTARSNLGSVLSALGRPEDSIAAFRGALERDPDNAEVLMHVGFVQHRQLKQLDDAMATYRQALSACEALDPPRPRLCARIHLYLGQVEGLQGREEAALAQFREAVRLDPGNPRGHFEMGFSLAAQGKNEEAITSFLRVVQLDPRNADAFAHLAFLLGERRDAMKAMEAAARALAIDPNHAMATQVAAQLIEAYNRERAAATQPSTTQSTTGPTTRLAPLATRGATRPTTGAAPAPGAAPSTP